MPKITDPSGLSPKMRLFVSEYLIDGKAERSAIAAGYPKAAARAQATRLLRHPAVMRELEVGRKRVTDKIELTAEKVLLDIARIAQRAEENEEFNAALKGHELLGKYLKLFTDKLEHAGKDGGPIQFQITEREADL